MYMSTSNKKFTSNTLIIYMISALLFLTFVELHIHTQEAASTESHGFAVSISNITEDLADIEANNEITVSPDSFLKVEQVSVTMLAVFMLIAVLITGLCRTSIGRMREAHTLLPHIPFQGTPPLRAPPQ